MKLVLVQIENFQRHQRLAFEPHDGLTAVVGSSDAGKSAVIRAIRWALLNEPAGTQLIRHGEKQCSVRLVFENPNVEVLRIRAKTGGVNHWSIKRDDEVAISLDAVGQGVPDPIKQAFPVDIWREFGSAGQLNFGLQKSTPFLVGHTSGERASILEGISDGILDQAAAELNKSARSADSSSATEGKSATEFEAQSSRHQQEAQRLRVVVENASPLLKQAEEAQVYANRCRAAAKARRDCAATANVVAGIASKEVAVAQVEKLMVQVRDAQGHATKIREILQRRAQIVEEGRAASQAAREPVQLLGLLERDLVEANQVVEERICPTCKRPL